MEVQRVSSIWEFTTEKKAISKSDCIICHIFGMLYLRKKAIWCHQKEDHSKKVRKNQRKKEPKKERQKEKMERKKERKKEERKKQSFQKFWDLKSQEYRKKYPNDSDKHTQERQSNRVNKLNLFWDAIYVGDRNHSAQLQKKARVHNRQTDRQTDRNNVFPSSSSKHHFIPFLLLAQ